MTWGNPSGNFTLRKTAPALFVIIYAIGALIYGNSLPVPFYFDDRPNITENPHIRLTRPTPSGIADIPGGHPVGRVFTMFTFAGNYYFHKYRVAGYRLVNLFIHMANGGLVFVLAWLTMKRLGNKPFIVSAAASLIWLVHPTHTQSVTYIVQRMNSLATMFYLLSMTCYIRGRLLQVAGAPKNQTIKWFFGCGLAGLLGLTSKEIVATLPAFLFLYEWFFFQGLDSAWLKRNRSRLLVVALLSSLIAAVYLGSYPPGGISDSDPGRFHTSRQRLQTQPRVVVYYLSLLAWGHPARLTLDYDFPPSDSLLSPATSLLAVGVLIVLLVLAIYTARKNILVSFSIFWFLGNLVIESSVIDLALVFEHRLYLPSIFPVIAVTTLLTGQTNRKSPTIAVLIVFIIAGNGLWTYQRNTRWQDPVRFWRDACAKTPHLARPYNDYGMSLLAAEKIPEAEAALEKAITLSSGKNAAPYNNLGLLYYRTGNTEAARDCFLNAIQAQPTFARAYVNLGILLAENGDGKTGERLVKTALELDPRDAAAHNALGKIYYESGRVKPAIRHCRQALELDPGNVNAENNLGAILLGIGETEQAIPHLARVVSLAPDLPEANMNIGIAYGKTGDSVKAVFYLFRAVFLAPDNPDTRLELGYFLLHNGKYRDARVHLEKALELKPDFPGARMALASAFEKLGLTDRAMATYQEIITADPGNHTAGKRLEILEQNTTTVKSGE